MLAAVALWRQAALRDDNPWAQIMLADALEKGEGVAANPTEALTYIAPQPLRVAMPRRGNTPKRRWRDWHRTSADG